MKSYLALALAFGGVALAGCIQMPTESRSSVDLRPQLSFSVANPALDPADLDVSIDGLPVGVVGNYLSGDRAVRVRAGSHLVVVAQGRTTVFEERIYVGDGMNKTIVVH